jgi:hypothetical protein
MFFLGQAEYVRCQANLSLDLLLAVA